MLNWIKRLFRKRQEPTELKEPNRVQSAFALSVARRTDEMMRGNDSAAASVEAFLGDILNDRHERWMRENAVSGDGSENADRIRLNQVFSLTDMGRITSILPYETSQDDLQSLARIVVRYSCSADDIYRALASGATVSEICDAAPMTDQGYSLTASFEARNAVRKKEQEALRDDILVMMDEVEEKLHHNPEAVQAVREFAESLVNQGGIEVPSRFHQAAFESIGIHRSAAPVTRSAETEPTYR